MDYLREVVKIAEWGLRGDPSKVSAYVQQLIESLVQKGDEKAVQRLRLLFEENPQAITTSSLPTQTRLPVDGESRLALADEETVNPTGYPVILDTTTTGRIEEFISFVKNGDKLEAHGVGLSPSLITYGPPGTGKTQLARFIAGRLGMPLLTARADTLISSFLGSTSKNLRTLFDHVAHRHCILFLDEIDAFAKLRDDQQELGELKRVVVSLLQNLDAMDHNTVLLAATNHDHLLDPAIWRRFAFRIPLALPRETERREILELFLTPEYVKQIDLECITQLTESMSGSDLRALALDAIRDTIIHQRKAIDSDRLTLRIIQTRLKGEIDFADPSSDLLKSIREIAPGYFTGKRLSELFRVSRATVSRKLSKQGGEQ
jgi:hypothetical protein